MIKMKLIVNVDFSKQHSLHDMDKMYMTLHPIQKKNLSWLNGQTYSSEWYCHLLLKSRVVGSNLTQDFEIFRDDFHLLVISRTVKSSLLRSISTEIPCFSAR